MSEPKAIGQIMCKMAADPNDPVGKLLSKCPVIQSAMLKQKIISLDNLTNKEIEKLVNDTFIEDWIDNQEVMHLLHISPRTLQTLRSNGILPYSRINNKIYYRRQDIQQILADNYKMNSIRYDYGKKRQ